jgi:tRNA pseudouridine38-40 synthase
MRIAAGIEYDGSRFCGWQVQCGTRTVQGCLEAALSNVADAPIRVITAGRTDTGVHARCQVVHFDTDRERSLHAWVRGTTSNLPDDVSVLWARTVPQDFHARYSATERRYCYVILNRRVRPAILRSRVTWEYRPLEAGLMAEAAAGLEGTHDFSAFRAAGCQAKSPVRELRSLAVRREGNIVIIEARANAFLHHMVRNLAGVLISIGAGERPASWAREVLEGRERSLGGVTAPPDGLYLAGVSYPQRFGIPECEGDRGPWG